MSTSPDYATPEGEIVTGWVGWIALASTVMATIGVLNIIQGLAALFRDEAYWVTLGGTVLAFDLTAWGWIQLALGILLVLTAISLTRGSTFARVLAVALLALNIIAQFSWSSVYPFWALIVIALDIVVIYALVVHGGELRG